MATTMKFWRFLAIFLAIMALATAQNIEVTADEFFADEKALKGDLKGNVVIKKGDFDTLWTNHAIIYFNAKKEPTKYIATGNTRFQIALNGKKYDGSGDELTYDAAAQTYTLKTAAYLHEIDTDKKIYGDLIVINQAKGTYQVTSKDKEPVKFIFQIKEPK